MEKVLNKYETIFVLDAELSDEQREALVEKFKALIAEGGELGEVEVWGKRRLAYEIDYKTEGYYFLANFSADSEFPKELKRIYGITEGVIRTIIIRKDE